MPTLHWIGKEKVINHHLDVPFRTLEKQYTYSPNSSDDLESSDKLVGDENMIIHSDNLEALKALLPRYEGRVKCIYIDPPYNTGNEGWVYNDNVNDPKIKRWLHAVVGKEGEDLSRHDKWLCMMYPRLKLLHKLLAEDGAIFISLDENETHHIRLLLNEIFGEINFVSQITLLCNPKGRSQDKYFGTSHEYCLIYSKNVLATGAFSVVKDDKLISKEYKLSDEIGAYRLIELRNTHREFNKENRPNLFYSLYVDPKTNKVSLEKDINYSIEIYPLWPDGFEGCWTWGKDLSSKDIDLLTGKKTKNNWKIYRKSYSENNKGEVVRKKLFTIWQDPLFYTEKGQITFGQIFPGLNKNDFPQPKSVDYIKEIIRTITTNNDIILDSFAGSGTTAHAVLNLNKQDGGNRKFILVEMEDYAESITAERVKRVMKQESLKPTSPPTPLLEERGERKGEQEESENSMSFSFYELGAPLFGDEGHLNEAVGVAKIREYVWYTETQSKPLTPEGGHEMSDCDAFLGVLNDTAYYFHYEAEALTTLNHEFLSGIRTKAGQYIIYADNCLLTKAFMTRHHIVFKKIPRDIRRF